MRVILCIIRSLASCARFRARHGLGRARASSCRSLAAFCCVAVSGGLSQQRIEMVTVCFCILIIIDVQSAKISGAPLSAFRAHHNSAVERIYFCAVAGRVSNDTKIVLLGCTAVVIVL